MNHVTYPRPLAMPEALTALIEQATRFRRSFTVRHGADDEGAPFVTLRIHWQRRGQAAPVEIRATWHTRATGTYRLVATLARWQGRPWHDISTTKAHTLIADGAELQPALETASDPTQEWARVWCDPYLAENLGEKLTCSEVDVVADLLATLGMPRPGLAWLACHAQGDDSGDAHWELRQRYPVGRV